MENTLRYRAPVEADGHFLDAIHAEYTDLYLINNLAAEEEDDAAFTSFTRGDRSLVTKYYKAKRNQWWEYVEEKRREFKIVSSFKEILNGNIKFRSQEDAVWFALKWS